MTTSASRKILVVDDEVEISEAVKAILEDEGFQVLSAADGTEAVGMIQENKPDLILMDVMMPKMSGYEVLDQIHREGFGPIAPVVLMSCVNPQVKQSKFKWQYFLKKPFNIDELLAVVKRYISK